MTCYLILVLFSTLLLRSHKELWSWEQRVISKITMINRYNKNQKRHHSTATPRVEYLLWCIFFYLLLQQLYSSNYNSENVWVWQFQRIVFIDDFSDISFQLVSSLCRFGSSTKGIMWDTIIAIGPISDSSWKNMCSLLMYRLLVKSVTILLYFVVLKKEMCLLSNILIKKTVKFI